jgi:PPM family protein phosphatase
MATLTVGVECSAGTVSGAPAANADNFLVGHRGQVTIREGPRMRTVPAGGAGDLLAVADGLGEGAVLASDTAVRVAAKLYRPGVPRRPAATLLDFVQRAHTRLYRRAGNQGSMGSTLTLAWVLDGQVHWLQIGHSRLYLDRERTLTRLTPDHTHREFAVRDGHTLPDAPDRLAQALIYGSRGLGHDHALRLEPGLDTGCEWLEPGDRLLLCTDGVWGVLDDVALADVLRTASEPDEVARAVIHRARQRGSTDNATAVVARVDRVPARTDPPDDRRGRRGSGRTFL